MYSPDDVYSLEDIIKALRANNKLGFNAIDALECPTKVQCTEVHLHKCPGIPNTCELCQKQKCKQHLTIFRKKDRINLIVLKFHFLLYTNLGSGVVGKGFIPKNDNQLKQLIAKKYITI